MILTIIFSTSGATGAAHPPPPSPDKYADFSAFLQARMRKNQHFC
jgi:hypothetical protein